MKVLQILFLLLYLYYCVVLITLIMGFTVLLTYFTHAVNNVLLLSINERCKNLDFDNEMCFNSENGMVGVNGLRKSSDQFSFISQPFFQKWCIHHSVCSWSCYYSNSRITVPVNQIELMLSFPSVCHIAKDITAVQHFYNAQVLSVELNAFSHASADEVMPQRKERIMIGFIGSWFQPIE